MGFIAVSINSGFEKVLINQIPSESHSHAPIIYAIAPPTSEPKDVATAIGMARFLLAIIGGVINTSGGINRNIDSNTVNMNTIQEYVRLSDLLRIYSANFISIAFSVKNLLDCNLIFYTLQ